MIDLLIIGGGMHGTCLSHLLTRLTPLTRDDVRVLDPNDTPLSVWSRCTRNCGMRYLRSPSVHHIDFDPYALDRFARQNAEPSPADFIKPNDRPSLSLFRRHCQTVIKEQRLSEMRIKGMALSIRNAGSHVIVDSATERMKAGSVLLALGAEGQPRWPIWARTLRDCGAPITHIFDPSFQRDDSLRGTICIVGAGISGVNFALSLAEDFDLERGTIRLIARGEIQVSEFDFDPGWLGPKYLKAFSRADLQTRRRMITKARMPGTMPGYLADLLDSAVRSKRIILNVDKIKDAAFQNGNIALHGHHATHLCDRVVLATGFKTGRPSGKIIDEAIASFGLKTAPCGFPILNPSLRWHERIFVTGPLSELQVGSCARNIAGARHAARKIAAAFGADSGTTADESPRTVPSRA